MKYKLEIDMGNAAFDEIPTMELARIIADTAARVQLMDAERVDERPIYDINGNKVGHHGFTVSVSTRPKRIKITDDLKNVSYIHHHPTRGWCCVLSNGTPASMFYAVGSGDHQDLVFRLEDAENDGERLDIVANAAGPRRIVEIFE